jgi:peptide deformylase
MPVYSVLLLGDPELRKKSTPVTDFEAPELRALLGDLKRTLTVLRARFGTGLALAAPLLGIHKRIIYFRGDPAPFFIINPEISGQSAEEEEDWETCFSFQMSFAVKFKRPKTIAMKYNDENGDDHIISCEGKMARLMLHEIDHLNGVLPVDYINNPPLIMRAELIKQRLSSSARWKKQD